MVGVNSLAQAWRKKVSDRNNGASCGWKGLVLGAAIAFGSATFSAPVMAGSDCSFGVVGVKCESADNAQVSERAGALSKRAANNLVSDQQRIRTQTLVASKGISNVTQFGGQVHATRGRSVAPAFTPTQCRDLRYCLR